jgi:hypothetical protein
LLTFCFLGDRLLSIVRSPRLLVLNFESNRSQNLQGLKSLAFEITVLKPCPYRL